MNAKLLLLMLILSPFGKIVLVSANADPSLEIGFESAGLIGWNLYIENKNYGDGNAIENQPQSGSFYTPIDENELVKVFNIKGSILLKNSEKNFKKLLLWQHQRNI